MKILAEGNLNYNQSQALFQNVSKIGHLGVISDMSNIAKALNDFQPDLLILKEENIDGIVKAYCNKNNVKLICFGVNPEHKDADITFLTQLDVQLPNVDVLGFKEDTDKSGISVFINNPAQKFLGEFLCQNYNVKLYGPVKINHPRYLGLTNNIEKYEILNHSKFSIVFNGFDVFDSALLDTYPIAYSESNINNVKTFNNLVSLMGCMEFIQENGALEMMREDQINMLKSHVKQHNSLVFTRDTLNQLGFTTEAEQLNNMLQEQL